MNAVEAKTRLGTTPDAGAEHAPRSGAVMGVLGGKGGVGKTHVAVNLAVAASRLGARVLLVDGDLGLSNVDVLLGLVPRYTAAEIRAGECDWTTALVEGPAGLHVLPAASARLDLAGSRPAEMAWLLAPLVQATAHYDLVLVDIGAGIGPAAMTLASLCGQALLVTTPEPTSVTDAYATLKVLRHTAPDLAVELVVNNARDTVQAHDTHVQLERMSQRFLGRGLALRATLPRDPRVPDAVALQRAVVEAFPTSQASRGLVELAHRVLRERTQGPDPADRSDGAAWKRIES